MQTATSPAILEATPVREIPRSLLPAGIHGRRDPLNPACALCLATALGILAVWSGVRFVFTVVKTMPRTLGVALAWSVMGAMVALGLKMLGRPRGGR